MFEDQIRSEFPHRVDERVRRLDIAEGRVQWQTEADCVVQTRFKTNRSGKGRIPEWTEKKIKALHSQRTDGAVYTPVIWFLDSVYV